MNERRMCRTLGMTNTLLKSCRFLFILTVLTAPLWGHPAFADTYDDFSSGTIQTSKWTITDPNTFFSVVPGSSVGVSQPYVLKVSGPGSSSFPGGSIWTTKSFSGNLLAGINFFNFTSDYTPDPTDTSSPSINLIIFGGHSDPLVLVARARSSLGETIGWRQYDKPHGTVLSTGGVPYSAASGTLLIVYAGKQLSLGYSTSTNPDEWVSTFTVLATFSVTFSVSPTLEIFASGGGGGTMGADIGGLYYSSKLPAILKGPSGVYDDFSSGSIQTSKWTITDPNTFFSVVPGSSVGVSQPYALQFTGAGDPSFPTSYLSVMRPFGNNLFAGINFYNFTSDFTPTATDPANPAIQLRVVGGSSDPVYLVARTHGSSGQIIGWRELDSSGNTLNKGGSSYSATSGALLVAYMGNQLSLGYSTSADPAEWANSFRAVASFPVTYTAIPTLEIGGSGGGDGSVSANVGGLYYSAQIPALSVALSGTGSGRVTSSPAGIDCGTTCAAACKKGTKLTLTPAPESGSIFAGWSGGCKGSGPCSVNMTRDITVSATFNTGTCTYAVSSKSKTLSYKGGVITLGIAAGAYTYCTEPEITVNNPDWITYTATAFAKNKGSIRISIPKYDYSTVRTGTMTIGENTVTVNQTGVPCSFTLSSVSSDFFSAAESTGTFTVTATPTDCSWTTKLDAKYAAWITINSGATGTGSGPIDYTVALNNTGKIRNGKITVIVSKKSKPYMVKQNK